VTFFTNQNITTYIDTKHQIAHNKVIVIDGTTLITGSYNFTKSAQNSNAENLLIIKNNPALINKYMNNAIKHREHSTHFPQK
jgi:phosphatidylserine/phosphatidylglycerophosphate/cardiolipin synthase-like enzyme